MVQVDAFEERPVRVEEVNAKMAEDKFGWLFDSA